MKKALGIGLAAVLAAATVAAAQPGHGCGNCGKGCRNGSAGMSRMYDASKAETVKGEVTAVETYQGGRRGGQGVVVTLKSGPETMDVHLGPQWYLDRQANLSVKAGDSIEVTGVRTVRRGDEIFLAGEVKKGGEVLKLRDEKGYPLWAGMNR
ncbi:MAG: hypothetical protein M0042_04405 [Nitrospiraceae bacterium]|nr:hypothetical protein [Nitrospiraceae bacterium]